MKILFNIHLHNLSTKQIAQLKQFIDHQTHVNRYYNYQANSFKPTRTLGNIS